MAKMTEPSRATGFMPCESGIILPILEADAAVMDSPTRLMPRRSSMTHRSAHMSSVMYPR